MGKVQSIQSSYLQYPRLKQSKPNSASKQNFTGEVNLKPKDIKKITDIFENSLIGRFNRFLKGLYDNDSEIQTQLINAVFTATLAPAVIAFNPFSKKTGNVEEDKRTKKYAALRQPISALIAIAGGVGMTAPIDHYVEKLASEGFIPAIDMRIKPMNLAGKFSKELRRYKSGSEEQKAFLESLEKEIDVEKLEKLETSKGNWQHWWKGRHYRKACCKAYIKKEQNAIEAFFVELMRTEPEKIKFNKDKGLVSIEGSSLKPRKIPNITKKEELDALVEKINLQKRSFGDFMKEHFKFDFYSDGSLNPYTLDSKLKDVKAIDFLVKLGLIKPDEITAEDLNRSLSEIRQDAVTIEEFGSAFEPGVLKPNDGSKKAVQAMAKESSRSAQMLVGDNIVKDSRSSLGQLFHRLGIKGDELQNLMNKTVAEAIDYLLESDKLKDLNRKIPGTDKSNPIERYESLFDNKTLKDFSSSMMENLIKKSEAYFKTFKKYTGIVANLFIVSITCTVLNWAYPRIVAKLFPGLLKDDKKVGTKEGGNK